VASRVVALALLLLGLVGMHVLSPTDAGSSAHRLVPAVASLPNSHDGHRAGPLATTAANVLAPADALVQATGREQVTAAPRGHDGGHDAGHSLLAGCLLALVGLAALAALGSGRAVAVLRRLLDGYSGGRLLLHRPWWRELPAHRPRFSLCVLRV